MGVSRGSRRKPKTFDDILVEIRARHKEDKKALGTEFEKITKEFLKTDTQYRKRFSKVFLWNDWKYKATVAARGTDIGVDLMAEENDGNWCAIQCKCYRDDGTLDYKTLSTFFSTVQAIAKRHKRKVNTILVFTGDRTTPNADKIIQINHCHVIGQDEFRDSSIIWDNFPKMRAREPKKLRRHQKAAFEDVVERLKSADRGKMIMACGTGKTLTALRVAEKHAGVGKTVLYLVPSISLIHQTMREWSENSLIKHHYAVVCSDKTAGEDEDGDISQLAFPPTTDVTELRESFEKRPDDAMGVVFSTYQSIQVAAKALGNEPYDLVLCDEAHRTAGAEKEQKTDPAQFTLVHDDRYVNAKKRVYMTATPRVYGEALKNKANVSSMDDPDVFGEEFHYYSFGQAVGDGQLSDFKVRVPVILEDDLSRYAAEGVDGMYNEDGTIDERVLLAAVWHGLNHDNTEQRPLLQRVIAFSNKVNASKQFAGAYTGEAPTPEEETYLKKAGENEEDERVLSDRSFHSAVRQFEETSDDRTGNTVSVRHVDGAMRASIRNNKMRWLKDSGTDPRECRILSNARCLSEGVDVPALDAVVFLQPRRSKSDVIQSVGRVMRRADDKEYGYVILPVVIPSGMTFEQSLHDNRPWRNVWQVLNALRSHDPNFADEINRVGLDRGPGGYSKPEHVEIIYMGGLSRMSNEHEMFGKLVTKMVEKVGDRLYYDDQAKGLGSKARDIRDVLTVVYESGRSRRLVEVVDKLCGGLRGIINPSMETAEAITVLAQHYSLRRIFDALFPREFRSANNVAVALDEAVGGIGMKNELEKFEGFYADVEEKISKLQNDEGKQDYIKKIYGNFLAGFDKKSAEKEGIVYTPDEVIDFIIHSVEHVLRTSFDTGFGCCDVKVFDPFTGTGAFITRLLESGQIRKDRLRYRYNDSIWANEINLLAYYVASVNIESVFARVSGANKHVPFRNINYTDTLNHHPRYRLGKQYRHRQKDLVGRWKSIHDDIKREQWAHIHIIMGNPPYSAGQGNYSNENPNVSYPEIDNRIQQTYLKKIQDISKALKTKVPNVVSIYDSYIRSIRWASDRIGESGVIAFVTNASFLRSEVGAGIRASLVEEFNEIWCFDLRGNALTKGEIRKREGGNVFGLGSKSPIAITILVKNPKKKGCVIRYKDIGDYHTREKKLEMIKDAKSIQGIKDWQIIKPDKYHDWLDQRGGTRFEEYQPIGSNNTKSGKDDSSVFRMYSRGIATSRDEWAYNSSKRELAKNMKLHISYCNDQDWSKPVQDPKKAKFSGELLSAFKRLGKQEFDNNKIRTSLYRPFFKQHMYFDSVFNSAQYRIPKFFPDGDSKNPVICTSYKFREEFSVIMTDVTPDIQVNYNGQVFPMYVNKDINLRERERERTRREPRHHRPLQVYWRAVSPHHRHHPGPRSHPPRAVLPVPLLQGGPSSVRTYWILHYRSTKNTTTTTRSQKRTSSTTSTGCCTTQATRKNSQTHYQRNCQGSLWLRTLKSSAIQDRRWQGCTSTMRPVRDMIWASQSSNPPLSESSHLPERRS